MTLTKNDYYEIAALMNDGGGSVEYEKEGETLYFEYSLDVDGYEENGYYDGTGAYIVRDAACTIDGVECYGEDGERTECNLDEALLEKIVEKDLITV